MQELHIWDRKWDQYYDVSNLDQATYNIQKSIFIQCISDELIMRIDSELDNCTSLVQLQGLVKEEFEKRNP